MPKGEVSIPLRIGKGPASWRDFWRTIACFMRRMVPVERIELPTFGLQNRCTTAVLHRLTSG